MKNLCLPFCLIICISLGCKKNHSSPDQPPTIQHVDAVLLTDSPAFTYQFTASATDPELQSLNYVWDFGDGTTIENGSRITHRFAPGKDYTVQVKASDGHHFSNPYSIQVSAQTTTVSIVPGANFWNIGWEGWQDFFKPDVNWATTDDPWNPVLIDELKEAKIHCLRFMDWNEINTSCIVDWNQRIPKTANHYNQDNKIPCFVDHYDGSTNTHTLEWNATYPYGVAYEWQIDLCNRIGADYWINIPVTASDDFVYQLALLIKSQLSSNLKVYIEWGNEVWNWGFATTVYAYQQAVAMGLDTIDVKAYCDPWRKYDIYKSVRVFKIFQDVFGADSNRLVKVIAGQVAYHWEGADYNHMVVGDLAALNNSIINPYGITIDAYAMAPYMGGQSISDQQNAIAQDEQLMTWAKNSLKGTNIQLICYESGADNYPDNNLTLTHDSQQEQLYVQYLTMLNRYAQGPVMQYCFYGGPWGLKNHAGEDVAVASKWRGWIDFWGKTQYGISYSPIHQHLVHQSE